MLAPGSVPCCNRTPVGASSPNCRACRALGLTAVLLASAILSALAFFG
jgi:hypothetical protein